MTEKTDIRDSDEKVVEIEMERLRTFTNHPFKVIGDSQMIELQDSIKNLLISATPYQWKHMIRQRTCRRNTKETRYVMLKIWEQLLEQTRELFSDCGAFCMNGGCEKGKMTCGKSIPPRCYQQILSGWIFQNYAKRVCWRKEYQMKIQLIDFGGRSPERAHANDAGADVFSPKDEVIRLGDICKLPLGFGLKIPDGYAGYIFPRSGLSSQGIV